ncbi:MAG TPA: cytochrome c1 [Burkholderiales bacterium]|nr:cytochrome c1 [Burkholderiales bacterium]
MKLRKILAALVLSQLMAVPAFANEAEVKLDHAEINVSDVASLQSGARTFVNYCLNCHSASLVRYNSLQNIGLTEQQIKDNLMFTADKIGQPMNVAFPAKDAKEAFGVIPPDLSVIARSRGADWLYTYLRGFYRDPKTVTGWNNVAFPNVGMPHVLWKLQGERKLTHVPVMRDGKPVEAHGHPMTEMKWETIKPGTMSTAEYDRTVRDLVNFLVWIGEPHQNARHNIGVWVVLALVLLIALTFALKSAYWKDIH